MIMFNYVLEEELINVLSMRLMKGICIILL